MNESNEIVEKVPPPEFESEYEQDRAPLAELYLSGPVLPICSPSFYRHAAKRPAFAALLFLVLFSLVVTVLHSIRVTNGFGEARQAIDDAFASGRIPEVTIAEGVAAVDAPQPYVAVDDGHSLIVLDTTGVYTGRELLDGGYESGLILTRDSVYSFDDQGRFQQTSLSDLNQLLPTIYFNAALVKRFVDLAQFFVFAGLFVWHVVVGPLYIILLGLGVWAVASMAKKQVSYSAVLVTGFYAAVPAVYGEYLMAQIDADVFLLYTLLLLIVWTVGLVAAVGTRRAGDWLLGERSLRAWRAVIGLPMLVIFALNAIYSWERGPLIVWVTAAVTLAALFIVGYLTGMRREEKIGPEKALPQG